MKDIEILPNAQGVPEVLLHGDAKTAADAKNITQVHISLSHSDVSCPRIVTLESLLTPSLPFSLSPLLSPKLRCNVIHRLIVPFMIHDCILFQHSIFLSCILYYFTSH